jgi:hypothetical protein
MANNSISLVNLDFDTLKNSFKTYLKSQSQFADYNFDGSNINVLLDILSYNSYLNAFYLNMAISESFLDSAQLRSSVVSRAKELNYTPRSYKSATATLQFKQSQASQQNLTIPSGTRFLAKTSNNSYTFTTNNAVVLYPSNSMFVVNLNVYEGVYVNDVYNVDYSIENQRFVLTNSNIDTDSLTVTVIENLGQVTTTFLPALNLYGLTNTSPIYFLQAINDSSYELVFGDGIFGRIPLNGAIISANYRITSGSDANYATNFSIIDIVGTNPGTTSITTLLAASGGANAESIDSIRYNAPKHFQTQERAITIDDYKSLILNNYPNIKSCHVFGGESYLTTGINYGTVYISPVTYSGNLISVVEKSDILNFISQRCTLGITPQIIDPDFLYLQINTTVKYNPNATVYTATDIKQIVNAAILNYNSEYLQDFNTEFKLSKFDQAINDSDPSISSNQTTVTIKKIASPTLNTLSYITIQYNNAIVPTSIVSSTFTSNGKLYKVTDYNPNINTFNVKQTNGTTIITNSVNTLYLVDVTNISYTSYTNIGTIDYNNGVVTFNQLNINDFNGSQGLILYAQPQNQNITSYNNDVIEIDTAYGINISVVSV